MRTSVSVGVSNGSRVRKVSAPQDGVGAQWDVEGVVVIVRTCSDIWTCYDEQSCQTTSSSLTRKSTMAVTPAVPPQAPPSKRLSLVGMLWQPALDGGLPAPQNLSWHLFLWGPELTLKASMDWCQTHLGWNKNVLKNTAKWLTSLNKGHFILEYLKNISHYIKKSSGSAEEKFSTGYLSWKGSF